MARQVTSLETPDFVSVDRLLTVSKTPANLTFGIEAFDSAFALNFGQFAVFQGNSSHAFCMRLCARALLPQPLGPNCDVVFIDGGNNFDPYAISNNSIEQGLDPENVLERLHVSRAFTHHQLACIVIDKLSPAIEEFNARLIVVSDITQLYCDPDVRDDDKEDSLRIFSMTVQTLRMLARRYRCLTIVTNLQQRDPQMEQDLTHAAHVSLRIEQNLGLTKLTLLKHPSISRRSAIVAMPGMKILERFL